MRRVLEMGHGGFPLARPLYCDLKAFSSKLPPDTIYFGIDAPLRPGCAHSFLPLSISLKCVAAIEDACRALRPRRIQFLRMDARKTLFMSGFFDEIHLHNVITDPRVPPDDIADIAFEAERLLAPGGFFIVTCERSHVGDERMAYVHFAAENSGLAPLSHPDVESATVFHTEVSRLCLDQRSFITIARKDG